jgi:O-antigen/teichoic acid export membrane protein
MRKAGKQMALNILKGSVFFLIIIYTINNQLQEYLNNASQLSIWIFSGIVISAAFSSLNSGFFQGLQKFNIYISLGLIWAVLRIIGAFILIALCGLGVEGALGGALLSQLLVCLLSFYFIANYIFQNNEIITLVDVGDPKERHSSSKDILLTVAATTSFVMMSQLDVIMANQFFAPEIASQYAAAAILGKAVLYVPGGLVFALFPMVIVNDANQISSKDLIKQAIATTFILCLPICICYFFFGRGLIEFFYGNKYPIAGELLSYYGFVILPMSIIMVMEHFLLAKGRILFTSIFALLVPVQIAAIFLWHQSLFILMGIVFIVGSAAVLIGLSILGAENKIKPVST